MYEVLVNRLGGLSLQAPVIKRQLGLSLRTGGFADKNELLLDFLCIISSALFLLNNL